jgi:hypothetical protein
MTIKHFSGLPKPADTTPTPDVPPTTAGTTGQASGSTVRVQQVTDAGKLDIEISKTPTTDGKDEIKLNISFVL